ncbi:MAG: hypothetical protein U0869_05600 [Chloroflexota bacterium]
MKRALTGAAGTALLASAFLLPSTAAQSPSAAPSMAPMGSPAAGASDAHPAHIHDGTCAAVGDVVAPLRDISINGPGGGGVTTGAGVEFSITRVDLTIPQMLKSPHVINAHLSADQIDTYIACGAIEGKKNDRNLVVELQEQNASGYRGIAFLQEDGDKTIVFTVLFDPAEGTGSPVGGPSTSFAPLPSVAASLAPLPSASTAP